MSDLYMLERNLLLYLAQAPTSEFVILIRALKHELALRGFLDAASLMGHAQEYLEPPVPIRFRTPDGTDM